MNNAMTTDANLRALLKAISSPIIWPYISKEKLVNSELFSRLIQNHDEHFSRYRDIGPFERILKMLDGSQYRDMLARYLRVRHGIIVSRENGKLKTSILKATAAIAPEKSDIGFDQFLVRPKSVTKANPPKKTGSGKSLFKKDHIDALDHPARLPGSFGHGKRS